MKMLITQVATGISLVEPASRNSWLLRLSPADPPKMMGLILAQMLMRQAAHDGAGQR